MKEIKDKMNCGIYKITNLINGKIYIGQSVNIKNRISTHKGFPTSNYMYNDMKEFGLENFTFETIIVCSPEHLNLYEKLCIDHYNCVHPYGYNLTKGGNEQIEFSEETIEKIRKSSTGRKRDNYLKGIHNPNYGKRSTGKIDRPKLNKKIEDVTGRVWDSVQECAKFFGVDASALSKKLLKHKPNYYRHLDHLDLHYIKERAENYEYKKLEDVEKYARKQIKKSDDEIRTRKTKSVIDNTGRVWRSVTECAIFFGIKGFMLSNYLLGRFCFPEFLEPYGLKYEDDKYNEEYRIKQENIRLSEEYNKERIKNKRLKEKIPRGYNVFDCNGNKWSSLKECAKSLGYNYSYFLKMLRGVKRTKPKILELKLVVIRRGDGKQIYYKGL